MTSDQVHQPKYDLVLKGGHVIDPANGIDGPMDVGIANGKITGVIDVIPTTESALSMDVSSLYVTPGIVDIHTHVYPFRPNPKSYVESVNADAHRFSVAFLFPKLGLVRTTEQVIGAMK